MSHPELKVTFKLGFYILILERTNRLIYWMFIKDENHTTKAVAKVAKAVGYRRENDGIFVFQFGKLFIMLELLFSDMENNQRIFGYLWELKISCTAIKDLIKNVNCVSEEDVGIVLSSPPCPRVLHLTGI